MCLPEDSSLTSRRFHLTMNSIRCLLYMNSFFMRPSSRTKAFSRGEGFHSIRRFPHCKTFSLHFNICRYCPDRGKPCHYDHLSTFTRSITNRSVSDPSCHFLHSALKNPKFKKAPENRRFLNEFKILTPPLMKLSKRKNISKGGIGCSVTLLLFGADLLFLAS